MQTVGRHHARLSTVLDCGNLVIRPRATARVLEELKQLGPFFALELYVDERAMDQWRPLRSLIAEEALQRRSEQMTRYLSTRAGIGFSQLQPRVASSVMHLGLVARLISPWIGLAAMGHLVRVRLTDLRWIPEPGSNFALSASPGLFERNGLGSREEWAQELVRELIGPLTNAVPGSPAVLWGNVSSALHGCVSAVEYTRPSLAPALRDVADHVLRAIPGGPACSGVLGTDDFRRSSCCLIYRVGGAASRSVCGDCVLRDLRDRRS